MTPESNPASSLFVPPRLQRASLLDDAKLILRLISEHPDLDPRACSRLTVLARAVAAGGTEIIAATRQDFGLVQQANKDLLEFRLIWETLQPGPHDRLLWTRLKRLFNDEALPSQSDAGSEGRQAQFELLCQAMLMRAGMEPVHQQAGPDFLCRLGDHRFMVEAKTARGVRAIEREVKRASDQIQGSGYPGIILLDYTFDVNESKSEHVHAFRRPVTSMGTAQRARFRFLHSRFLHKLEARAVERGVIGIQYVDRLVIQDGIDPLTGIGRWQLATFRDNRVLLCRWERDKLLVRTVFQLLSELGLPAPPEPR